jgi:hypothetical protein
VSWLHITVNALFVVLMVSLIVWVRVYHGLDKKDLPASPGYRTHQWLIALIMLLILLLVVIIVFSSDPGSGDEMWLWY